MEPNLTWVDNNIIVLQQIESLLDLTNFQEGNVDQTRSNSKI